MADLSMLTSDELMRGVVDFAGGRLAGSGFPPGSLTGRPLDATGGWICDVLRWVSDNNAFVEVYGVLEFRPEGVFIGARIVSKATGQTLKIITPQLLDGHIHGESDVRQAIYEIGRRMAMNVTRFLQAP